MTEELLEYTFGERESIILNFGEHIVVYLLMNIFSVGSPPNPPLHLKLMKGERPIEID